MRFVTETISDTGQALFVYKNPSAFIQGLENKMETYGLGIVHKSGVPIILKSYTYIFIYSNTISADIIQKLATTRSKSLIMTSERKSFEEIRKLIQRHPATHAKLVNIDAEDETNETLERVLWFMMSRSSEQTLNLERAMKPMAKKDISDQFRGFNITRRQTGVLILMLFLFLELFFLLPLAGSTYFLYRAGIALKDQNIGTAQRHLNTARPLLSTAQASYKFSKPTFLLLLISLFPENILSIEDNVFTFMQTAIKTSQNSNAIFSLLLKQDKTTNEINEVDSRIKNLNKQIDILVQTSEAVKDRLDYDNDRIKKARKDFEKLNTNLSTTQKLVTHMDKLLGSQGQKKFLVFFYNNMEIRPGGGFIGSFGTITFDDYTLKGFDVIDVYDADGQLTSHIEPPLPIRKYLGEIHWFLRDSNFNPDFVTNVNTAEFFIDQELALGQFDGALAITTTGLSYLLEAFGDVYIADFDESINKDNFYLKIQTGAENEFFPGSSRKKNYLSTLGRSLFLKLEEASPAQLALSIKRALDEKHIVINSKDKEIQDDIDSLGWNGKVVAPQCVGSTQRCIINHLFPIDANLGVNKVNFFINRAINLITTIDEDGTIHNTSSVLFINNSTSDKYPGGIYKNYFQLYLPHDAIVSSVSHNGKMTKNYEENKTNIFKTIGTFIEIPPGETIEVAIDYELAEKILTGTSTYQIVIQKQIGTFNSDFFFEINLPHNIFITDQNFKSLAKNQAVRYNSSLSTDRVFVIELLRE